MREQWALQPTKHWEWRVMWLSNLSLSLKTRTRTRTRTRTTRTRTTPHQNLPERGVLQISNFAHRLNQSNSCHFSICLCSSCPFPCAKSMQAEVVVLHLKFCIWKILCPKNILTINKNFWGHKNVFDPYKFEVQKYLR